MKITKITAVPISFRIPEGGNVTLGIGRAVKRDAVLVRVDTDEGITGWGEAHHGRCPGAIAKLIDTTLADIVVGMDAGDIVGVWSRVYRMQLASHGLGSGSAMALSGLDIALWDIKGKALGQPLYRILGGAPRPSPAYAGGISLGWQDPASLAEEALRYVAQGYRAVKLRVGDSPARDIPRVRAVREAVGDDIAIMVDANTGYTLGDVRRVMPVYEELAVEWLEEPFPPHDLRDYREARALGTVPLAAGENHVMRYDFMQMLEEGAITVPQPDVSKTGGLTETLRIAALVSTVKMNCNPHTSLTSINMAASIHLLCAIDNPGYYEGDCAPHNPFRNRVGGTVGTLDANGCVWPTQGPGLGLEIDEEFIAAHPLIDGPCYV